MKKNDKIWLTLLFLLGFIFIVVSISYGMAFTTQDSTIEDRERSSCDLNHFSDVGEKDWFSLDVNYVCNNNLMNGTSNTTFSPDIPTTRGMMATILWRLEGEPCIESEMVFSDVSYDQYYYKAVMWATENKIVNGYDVTAFRPEDIIIREQLAAMLYRYATYKNYDVSDNAAITKYKDGNQVSEYAVAALEWASAKGIITGTPENKLMPQGNALRCQVAAILKRFCTQVVPAKPVNMEETMADRLDKNSEQEDSFTEESKKDVVGNNTTSTGSSNNIPDSADDNTNHRENEYPILSINDINAKPGEIVQIAVDLKNNPGILGMALSVHYDESKCTLQGVRNGEAFQDILDMITSKTMESGARFLWDGVDISQDDIKDGTILIMNFKINDDATPGKCPITMKYSDGDIVNKDLEGVSLVIENGYIVIL